MLVEEAPRCANHPAVETWVSCASCGKPICPDCMIQAPVGIKCRQCARMPRSARVRLKPVRGARAVGLALVLGIAIGAALASLPGAFGFFSFIIAYFVGRGMGMAVKRASGYHRGGATGWIAAAGALLAYVSPIALAPALFNASLSLQLAIVDVVLGGVAAFFAYREVT